MSTENNTVSILSKPKHIASLATAGMLIHVEVTVWTATKQDRDISDEITLAKKADPEAGRFVKNLLANVPSHKACLNDRQTWYNWVQRETFPWSGSWRYLPAPRIPKFMQDFKLRFGQSESLKVTFLTDYPQAVSNMAFVQGDMFRREDYPTVDEIAKKFSVNLYTAEVPVGDFRCKISEDLADDLTVHFERQAREKIEQFLLQQQEQMIDAMQSLAHCCETETVNENGEIKVRRRKIYDTTLTRLQEMCDTFREFNLAQDARLEDARAQLEALIGNKTIDQLRNSDTARVVVKEGLEDILSKFGV
jgi:hypothetical protein